MARSVLREHSVRDRSLVVGNLFVQKRSLRGGQYRDRPPLTVFADTAFDGDRFRIARVHLPCEPKALRFLDRKSTRLNSSHGYISYAVFCLKKKKVFCSECEGNRELYMLDADGNTVRTFTNAPGCSNGGPFFSADGKRVIFRSARVTEDQLA